jgi:histidine triad (HIT) family protein
MAETIFSKIIRGEVPCHKVYEDDLVFALLDIHPIAPGHTLVIPKEPARTFDELSEASAAALGRALPKLCRAVKQATGVNAYNLLQNNGSEAHQAVFHVHIHIIPKPSSEQGLAVGWPSAPLAATDAEQMRQAIVTAIA